MNHVMTEKEWRSKTRRSARPDWWGAQCVYVSNSRRLQNNRFFQQFLVVFSVCTALVFPSLFPIQQAESFAELSTPPRPQNLPRSVSAVQYSKPDRLFSKYTATKEDLIKGKLLLINDRFSAPRDLPAPNTFSIAAYGKGMVPVRSLRIQSGRETIDALTALFSQLRSKGVEGVCVWQGTISFQEQQTMRKTELRGLMKENTVNQAVVQVNEAMDPPGKGDLLQEYTVEIRLRTEQSDQPDQRRPEESPEGQTLLQLAWRYGFIRTHPNGTEEHAWRFRYVGKAHAAAMTYLDLDLENYLNWLHEKRELTIYAGEKPQYFITCQPVEGKYVDFQLPAGTEYEMSLDNTGYAVAACVL